MVWIELSSNLKIGRLNDAQFRCLVTGIWAVAAKANPRGYLIVVGEPATADDIARQARCKPLIARQTLQIARSSELVEMDDELGVEFVHDWWEINPDPKPDPTNAERQARWRERRRAARNAERNAASNAASNAPVTVRVTHEITGTEVKEKEKVGANAPTSTSSRSRQAHDLFEYWQHTCHHPGAIFDSKRRAAVEGRLRDGFTTDQIRQGIDGAARAAFVNDAGKRFDDIELICRNASKLESFVDRATASNVIALRGKPGGPSDLWRAINGEAG